MICKSIRGREFRQNTMSPADCHRWCVVPSLQIFPLTLSKVKGRAFSLPNGMMNNYLRNIRHSWLRVPFMLTNTSYDALASDQSRCSMERSWIAHFYQMLCTNAGTLVRAEMGFFSEIWSYWNGILIFHLNYPKNYNRSRICSNL